MFEEIVECSICFSIIVEPIRIKCSHIFCLECIERLLTNNEEVKCPMDRTEFDYLKDLKYDETILFKNFRLNPCECKKVVTRIMNSRDQKKFLKEFRLVYGNYHEFILN